ncbi:MAG: TolC family protein [Planctomycetota bacterium]|jgi:outer membrane protein TolC|nr:TolC family protein [Planctomycetota bacterium]
MNRSVFTIFLAALISSLALQVASEETESPPKRSTIKLSLDEAIIRTLNSNLNIEISSLTPKINRESVVVARSVFDPVFSNSLTASRSLSESSTSTTGTNRLRTDTFTLGPTLTHFLPTGATWSSGVSIQKTRTNSPFAAFESITGVSNPQWTTSATFSITQPLLRNMGFGFNYSSILIAEDTLSSSESAHQSEIMDTVQSTMTAYWSLLNARENVLVERESLARVEEFLRLTRLQVREGKMAPIEVYESESNLAQQQESVLRSEKILTDAEDALKTLIDPLDKNLIWNVSLIPIDHPEIQPIAVDAHQSARTALRKRPILEQNRLAVKSSRLSVLQARNQVLPSLDASGSLQLTGDGHFSFGNSVDDGFSGEFYTWSFGLSFELPLGNRSFRAQLRQANYNAQKSLATLRGVESLVVMEVREAVRELRTTYQRYQVTRKGSEAARKRMEGEEKLFREGKSTNFRLQQLRSDLLLAQLREITARVDHYKAMVDLERAEGTILDNLAQRGIRIRGR